jgi:hypothetical protein
LVAVLVIAAASFVALHLRNGPTSSWVGLIVICSIFGSLTALGSLRLGRAPVSATLGEASLSFGYVGGNWKSVEWGNPRLSISLIEWDSTRRAGVDYPYRHELSPLLAPSIPLTKDAFTAIVDAAGRRGLRVVTDRVEGPLGTARTDYVLKPPAPDRARA